MHSCDNQIEIKMRGRGMGFLAEERETIVSKRGRGGKLRRPNGGGGCRVEEEEGKGWVLG